MKINQKFKKSENRKDSPNDGMAQIVLHAHHSQKKKNENNERC